MNRVPVAATEALQAETVKRLCNLPPLNPAATRLLTVSADSDSALQEYRKIFSSDPSLAAELLRVSNSAAFGTYTRFVSIERALIHLGIEQARRLGAALAAGQYSKNVPAGHAATLWRHGIATAVIADKLGVLNGRWCDSLFTAGLTHDLGRAGLLRTDAHKYGMLLDATYHDLDECTAVEKILFGMTHFEAGAHLAAAWTFPDPLTRAVRCHHDADVAENDGQIAIVHAACGLAWRLGYPELPNCPAPPTGEFREHWLPLPDEQLVKLVEDQLNAFGSLGSSSKAE